MGSKITVTTRPGNRISINSPQRQQIKSVSTVGVAAGSGVDTLAELKDVDASSPDNNETLVYDSFTQKYIIKTLPVIDGGSY